MKLGQISTDELLAVLDNRVITESKVPAQFGGSVREQMERNREARRARRED